MFTKNSLQVLMVLVGLSISANVFAASITYQSNVLGNEVRSWESGEEVVVNNVKEDCGFTVPEEKVYTADIVTVRKKTKVEEGEVFEVKAFMRNSGNMPWFSNKSTCKGPKMSLGTDKLRNHKSGLYVEPIEDLLDSGWESVNRVGMDQLRVDPGRIASFTFLAEAPDKPDVFKEYFTPVLKDIQWIEDRKFSVDVIVGEHEDNLVNLRQKMMYSLVSGSATWLDLDAEREILVDLSDQKMFLKLGGQVVREFPVSTGAARTPTPTGTTYILLKQQVRVGGKWPHYIMPKFMMFRAGGYGIHALPSLGTDGGWFWTEARNHIGIPVSHGCIRLLPEDADFAFEFVPVGAKVVVQW